ncbi:hypothetical protein BGZ46_005626, partial [Entomortierella lignicola]
QAVSETETTKSPSRSQKASAKPSTKVKSSTTVRSTTTSREEPAELVISYIAEYDTISSPVTIIFDKLVDELEEAIHQKRSILKNVPTCELVLNLFFDGTMRKGLGKLTEQSFNVLDEGL